jgi:hypothetical protein
LPIVWTVQPSLRLVVTLWALPENELAAGIAFVEDALRVLDAPQSLYRRMSPEQRQLLNEAIFEKLYVDHTGVTGASFNAPFDELLWTSQTINTSQPIGTPVKRHTGALRAAGGPNKRPGPLNSHFFGDGSNKGFMVQVLGRYSNLDGSNKGVMVGTEGFEPSLEAV